MQSYVLLGHNKAINSLNNSGVHNLFGDLLGLSCLLVAITASGSENHGQNDCDSKKNLFHLLSFYQIIGV